MNQIQGFFQKTVRSLRQQITSRPAAAETNGSTNRSRDPAMAWVIPQSLAVGRLPQSSDIPLLLGQNIQVIVSLCSPKEGSFPPALLTDFEQIQQTLPDQRHQQELTLDLLAAAVATVADHLERGQRVYVHCLAGLERSPTVCLAYLCRYKGLAVWEALQLLKQVYPASAPTADQLQVVQAYLRSANLSSLA
ncbi:protein-tyrosine phosphatase family protein [Prochlorothrix hollandica]